VSAPGRSDVPAAPAAFAAPAALAAPAAPVGSPSAVRAPSAAPGRSAVTSLRRVRGSVALLGPAFVVGIAYVDPGNVATNFTAGSRYGYRLLWVVVAANLVAGLVQTLSAKLGLATGRSLAEVSRERWSRPVVLVLWAQAEVVAVATDLAELVGGALALSLLFGMPLPLGALVTAGAAYGLLLVRSRGSKRFELAIVTLFLFIAGGYALDAVFAHPSAGGLAGGLVPGFAGSDSVLLAAAMVGATVMPHAVYLHSALTRRTPPHTELSTRQVLRLQRVDVATAMVTAGLVNVVMVVIAAAVLPGAGDGIADFHAGLIRAVGGLGGFAFAVALLASGLASSGVGTLAGEEIMAGYLRRSVPRWVRRSVTLVPAVALLVTGFGAGEALVLSQLVLGLGVPFALVTLVLATRDRSLMGALVNRRGTTIAAVAAAGAVGADAVGAVSAHGRHPPAQPHHRRGPRHQPGPRAVHHLRRGEHPRRGRRGGPRARPAALGRRADHLPDVSGAMGGDGAHARPRGLPDGDPDDRRRDDDGRRLGFPAGRVRGRPEGRRGGRRLTADDAGRRPAPVRSTAAGAASSRARRRTGRRARRPGRGPCAASSGPAAAPGPRARPR
jgi:manganese transport protein